MLESPNAIWARLVKRSLRRNSKHPIQHMMKQLPNSRMKSKPRELIRIRTLKISLAKLKMQSLFVTCLIRSLTRKLFLSSSQGEKKSAIRSRSKQRNQYVFKSQVRATSFRLQLQHRKKIWRNKLRKSNQLYNSNLSRRSHLPQGLKSRIKSTRFLKSLRWSVITRRIQDRPTVIANPRRSVFLISYSSELIRVEKTSTNVFCKLLLKYQLMHRTQSCKTTWAHWRSYSRNLILIPLADGNTHKILQWLAWTLEEMKTLSMIVHWPETLRAIVMLLSLLMPSCLYLTRLWLVLFSSNSKTLMRKLQVFPCFKTTSIAVISLLAACVILALIVARSEALFKRFKQEEKYPRRNSFLLVTLSWVEIRHLS